MRRIVAAFGAVLLALTLGTTAEAQTIAPNPNGIDPEHYQCYTVTQPATFQPRTVTLRDQFGFRTVRVGAPRLLCAPVSKNNGLLADKLSHLVCYVTTPAFTANKRVEVTNQFGKLQFTVNTASLLCVPSLKRVLTAP